MRSILKSTMSASTHTTTSELSVLVSIYPDYPYKVTPVSQRVKMVTCEPCQEWIWIGKVGPFHITPFLRDGHRAYHLGDLDHLECQDHHMAPVQCLIHPDSTLPTLHNRGSRGDGGGKPQDRGEGGVAQMLQTVDVWGGSL